MSEEYKNRKKSKKEIPPFDLKKPKVKKLDELPMGKPKRLDELPKGKLRLLNQGGEITKGKDYIKDLL